MMTSSSFQKWVESNSKRVFAIGYRITGHVQDAEEVVQETFLKAYRQREQFRGEASPDTWLFRIATHCSLDLLRMRKRRSEEPVAPEILGNGLVALDPSAPKTLQGRHIREKLAEALKDLSAMERAAFVLRHFEGQSCKDIAQALDCNVNRAKQAVFRAVGKLRKTLKPLVTP